VSVDLESFLQQVTSPYEAVAAERGLRLRLLTTAPPDLVVHTDPLLLGRVLANLLDNACKFTPSGGDVELRASYGARGLCIVVADTGPGLPEHERERVFERFFRSASVRGSIEGFGLGLSLAQDLTRALGGELSALKTPVGAAFVIEIRARADDSTKWREIPPERTLPSGDGRRLLRPSDADAAPAAAPPARACLK
jgi:signal transduction histidine kinase